MATRTRYLVGFTVLSVLAAFLLPAMPQPVSYHDFAELTDDVTPLRVEELDVVEHRVFEGELHVGADFLFRRDFENAR